MGELILLTLPSISSKTLEELVEVTHRLAEKSENIYLNHPHTQLRMKQRNVTIRQVHDVLMHGKGIDGPTQDKYGDCRIKLKRFSAGRTVQVVVVVKDDLLEVITVI